MFDLRVVLPVCNGVQRAFLQCSVGLCFCSRVAHARGAGALREPRVGAATNAWDAWQILLRP
eukprot:6901586-Lingulodinium_polyedra.AAC.1